jgi:hypothetical protein
MAAFSPYSGAYVRDGREFNWRCYATTRVHDMRLVEHRSFDPVPGCRWVEMETRHPRDPKVACLVDGGVGEFSQILTQVACVDDSREQAA